MDYKDIQELIKTVSESNLTTVEIEKEGFRILLKKEAEKVYIREKPEELSRGGVPGEKGLASGEAAGEKEGAVSPNPAGSREGSYFTINSPIVGTFYASPSPGEEPFVEPGSRVKKGQTLCIIEAMKLMNEIEAEVDMEIVEVLVSDGQMVEYGQPLFVVEKLGEE